jgi:hypothetical protein
MKDINIIEEDFTLEEVKNITSSLDSTTELSIPQYNFGLYLIFAGGSLLTAQDAISKSLNITEPISYTESCKDYEKSFKNNIVPYVDYINESVTKQTITKHDLVRKILAFKSLNNSWDGYGSLPLEIESASNSIRLIDLIGEDIFCTVDKFYPNPNGTITFEWINNQDENIFVEVGNSSFSYFVKLASSQPKYFDNNEISKSSTQLLSEFIQTL